MGKLNYKKTLIDSLKFGINPYRWLPLFALDAICMSIIAIYLSSKFGVFISLLTSFTSASSMVMGLVGLALPLVVIVIVCILLKVWVEGAIIHQANKEKEFNQSWKVSCSRYPRLFLVMLVILVLTTVANMIPLAGFVLAIIVGLIFFFPSQVIMVDDKGALDSLRKSLDIFKKKPLHVFLVWIIIAIIGGIIAMVFMFPLTSFLVTKLLEQGGTIGANNITTLLNALVDNMQDVFIYGVIFLIGASIAKAFQLKAQTDFYKQLK
ncbi:MAG: hypothetical protein ISS36_03310 [Candidatus Aenigmarchaeota archaeon]|nr:hypothetical protein [Candidatus Aenigmarchaeota archaeon]